MERLSFTTRTLSAATQAQRCSRDDKDVHLLEPAATQSPHSRRTAGRAARPIGRSIPGFVCDHGARLNAHPKKRGKLMGRVLPGGDDSDRARRLLPCGKHDLRIGEYAVGSPTAVVAIDYERRLVFPITVEVSVDDRVPARTDGHTRQSTSPTRGAHDRFAFPKLDRILRPTDGPGNRHVGPVDVVKIDGLRRPLAAAAADTKEQDDG